MLIAIGIFRVFLVCIIVRVCISEFDWDKWGNYFGKYIRCLKCKFLLIVFMKCNCNAIKIFRCMKKIKIYKLEMRLSRFFRFFFELGICGFVGCVIFENLVLFY